MLWPSAILIAAAVVLAAAGWTNANSTNTPDEAAAGTAVAYALAIMAGIGGVLWWVIAVTWKAFS